MSRCFYADTLRPVPFLLIGPGQAYRVPITMPSALFLILNLEPCAAHAWQLGEVIVRRPKAYIFF